MVGIVTGQTMRGSLPQKHKPLLTRRILFLLLLAAGVLALVVGTLQGGWQRIHYLSTSI